MSLPKVAVERPVTILMVLAALIVLGVVSLSKLPVDLTPNLEFPALSVVTTYSQASPQEIEKSITRVIESAVSAVNDIDYIESTSSEGRSVVTVYFKWGSDLDARASDVREKLDFAKRFLPSDASSPAVFKFSTSMIPVMIVSITGFDDLEYLYNIAESQIKPKIEQTAGVASVSLSGGIKKIVAVDVYKNRLEAYGLGIDTLANVLTMENQNQAGGYTYEGVYKFLLRTQGEFSSLEDIENVVISVKNGIPIRLKEVASVHYADNKDQGIGRVNGKPAVSLTIYKQADRNTVQVSKDIRKTIAQLQGSLPQSLQFVTILDTAQNVQSSINNVRDAAVQGGLLAVIILLFFLWNFRTVLIIAISIPTSIIATFITMYFFKVSLNIVSLGGLALGVGIMVDSSIVVLENIFYYRQKGYGRYRAAVLAAEEVMLPIVASTLTTVAVFLPIVFVEGFTAQIFRDLALTVTISLLVSLVVAITLVPMLASQMIHVEENPYLKRFEEAFNRGWNSFVGWYQKRLEWALGHKRKALLWIFGSFVTVGLLILLVIGKEGMPQSDQGQFMIRAEFPVGTRREYVDTLTRQMEKLLMDAVGNYVVAIQAQVGSGSGLLMMGGNDYTATVRVSLVSPKKRTKKINEIMEEARRVLKPIPAKITVQNSGGNFLGGGSALTVEVQGDDLAQSSKLVSKITKILEDVPEVRNVSANRSDALPEIVLRINRVAASKLGFNSYTLAQTIKTAFGGRTATRFATESGDIDVVVQLAEEDRSSIDDILSLQVPSPVGRLVPLASLVDETKSTGPTSIYRKNNRRTVTISMDYYGKSLNQVLAGVQSRIKKEVFIPRGFTVSYGGAYKDMQESFRQLTLALLLAIFLVYAVMASQFESLWAPFVVLFTVPFGFVGSLVLLFVTGQTLNTISFLGVLILVGIVVNNGIILIDYMNNRMKEKISPDQVALESGVRRIRPIMMTTMTTVLGLIPMAIGIGEGSELYTSLAISILGGLSLSTVITLVVIPTIYAGLRKKIPIKIHADEA